MWCNSQIVFVKFIIFQTASCGSQQRLTNRSYPYLPWYRDQWVKQNAKCQLFFRAVKLPWIFSGALLTFTGLPEICTWKYVVYNLHPFNNDMYIYVTKLYLYIGMCASVCCMVCYHSYSISQEICTRFLLCCALLWLYIDWFSHIHQAYFTGTVAI